MGLHQLLSLRAAATIVHNNSQEAIVTRWGCRYFVIDFVPGASLGWEGLPLNGRFSEAVVNSLGEDEPLDVIFKAAEGVPEVDFHVTGDARRANPRLLLIRPRNCHFNGYLR